MVTIPKSDHTLNPYTYSIQAGVNQYEIIMNNEDKMGDLPVTTLFYKYAIADGIAAWLNLVKGEQKNYFEALKKIVITEMNVGEMSTDKQGQVFDPLGGSDEEEHKQIAEVLETKQEKDIDLSAQGPALESITLPPVQEEMVDSDHDESLRPLTIKVSEHQEELKYLQEEMSKKEEEMSKKEAAYTKKIHILNTIMLNNEKQLTEISENDVQIAQMCSELQAQVLSLQQIRQEEKAALDIQMVGLTASIAEKESSIQELKTQHKLEIDRLTVALERMYKASEDNQLNQGVQNKEATRLQNELETQQSLHQQKLDTLAKELKTLTQKNQALSEKMQSLTEGHEQAISAMEKKHVLQIAQNEEMLKERDQQDAAQEKKGAIAQLQAESREKLEHLKQQHAKERA